MRAVNSDEPVIRLTKCGSDVYAISAFAVELIVPVFEDVCPGASAKFVRLPTLLVVKHSPDKSLNGAVSKLMSPIKTPSSRQKRASRHHGIRSAICLATIRK